MFSIRRSTFWTVAHAFKRHFKQTHQTPTHSFYPQPPIATILKPPRPRAAHPYRLTMIAASAASVVCGNVILSNLNMDLESVESVDFYEYFLAIINPLLYLQTIPADGISSTTTRNNPNVDRFTTPPPTSASLGLNFIADAVEKVKDSVVNISVETDTSNLFRRTTLFSSGSGFFIQPGFVLTNAHVVSDMVESSRMIITTSDGNELDGYVYSLDTLSDLAIVRIREKSLQSLQTNTFPWPSVEFGDHDSLRLGDWVAAIGSPFGLQNTVTAGVISSESRKFNEIGGNDSRVRYIQTDCVVHSGSSGGPLINMNGHVIGINTTRAESEGISFAIRVADTTLDMINQLSKEGKVVRPFLGFHMMSLTKQLWTQLSESGDGLRVPRTGTGKGVLITNVLPASPAEKSGIMALDVVTHVNHHPVFSSHDLLSIVGLKIGAPVLVRLVRCVARDADGRLFNVEEHVLKVVPEELNYFLHAKIQQRRESGI